MSVWSVLKKILTIGATAVPAILSSVNPGMGMLVSTVLNAVLKAEAIGGPGNGAVKAEAAWNMVDTAAPAIVQILEMQTGKQIADEVLFQEGLKLVQEGQVKILNSFGLLLPSSPK